MGTATTAKQPQSRRLGWGVLAVALLTFVVHLRGITGQFLYWDDDTHITQNPYLRVLSWHNLGVFFTQPLAKLYIPFTWVSFAIDYQLWGRDPLGYHLGNILGHVVNTLLVIALVYACLVVVEGGDSPAARWVALGSAALFGVHPLHVESVAWATERKDVLFAFFYLAALLVYVTRDRAEPGRRGWYVLAWVLFVAAALSKATAVTLPAVLLLVDAAVYRRPLWGAGSGRVWLEKLPFFLVSALVAAGTLWAQATGRGETVASVAAIPALARVGLVGFCSLFYLGKFCWPVHLSAIYPTFDELGWRLGVGLALFGALVALVVVAVVYRRRVPAGLPLLAFYLITLSPTIGLLPVGIHVVADRYAYLAILGPAVGLMLGVVSIARRRRWVVVPAVLLVLGLAGASVRRTADWHDTGTLFESVLREQPRSLPALINLTKWHSDRGEYPQAIGYGERAVAVAPHSVPARQDLAVALLKAGQRQMARAVLQPLADDPTINGLLRTIPPS